MFLVNFRRMPCSCNVVLLIFYLYLLLLLLLLGVIFGVWYCVIVFFDGQPAVYFRVVLLDEFISSTIMDCFEDIATGMTMSNINQTKQITQWIDGNVDDTSIFTSMEEKQGKTIDPA